MKKLLKPLALIVALMLALTTHGCKKREPQTQIYDLSNGEGFAEWSVGFAVSRDGSRP